MTKEEIVAFQAKERAFYETPIGKAFSKFKRCHSAYWQEDGKDSMMYARLKRLDESCQTAEKELRELLEKVA